MAKIVTKIVNRERITRLRFQCHHLDTKHNYLLLRGYRGHWPKSFCLFSHEFNCKNKERETNRDKYETQKHAFYIRTGYAVNL